MLRYDAETGRFTWCSGNRYVQDAATTLQLTGRTTECKTADAPGTKGTGPALRDGDQKLGGNGTAAFQSALGSVMYVPEKLYSTKTVASFMQSTTKSAMVKLKRLVRYLVGFSQAEWAYSKQVVPKYLDVYGDSDWAGDEERKRSTTGVAEIFRGHLLDAVSVTQSLVALSSAEAEFYACNRGTVGATAVPAVLGVRRCTRGLAVASLITKVQANDFDARAVHVATVSLAHKVMLLVVGCVVLVLALVALAGAGADCWWHR